jgi:hypothetical protein
MLLAEQSQRMADEFRETHARMLEALVDMGEGQLAILTDHASILRELKSHEAKSMASLLRLLHHLDVDHPLAPIDLDGSDPSAWPEVSAESKE